MALNSMRKLKGDTMMSSELLDALDMLEKEKGISRDILLKLLKLHLYQLISEILIKHKMYV